MPEPVPDHPTPGMHIWGWMQPSELDWLASQAATMRTVVEIGALRGRSSYALAAACPGTLYCIDPWPDGTWEQWWANVGNHFSNVQAIRGYSPVAGNHVPDPVDMVFIDGSHDYHDVAADITYWNSRAQILLCGHDYLSFPSVARAVDDLLGSVATVVPDTWIWAYAKAPPEDRGAFGPGR